MPLAAVHANPAMLYQMGEESATFVPRELISRVSRVYHAQIHVPRVQVLQFVALVPLDMAFKELCVLNAPQERI